jgi:hypothetical protein
VSTLAQTANAQRPVPSYDLTAKCQVFVAVNGNDANPGTKSHPFASLERARDYVRAHKTGASAPIDVCLRGGTYALKRTFRLRPDDSGTAVAPIIYRSYPGERAVLIAGVRIHPHWSRYKGRIQVAKVDRSFNQLFINGKRATRARSPNGDASFFRLSPVSNSAFRQSSFLYQAGSVPTSLEKSDMEIVSMERFASPRQRVASTDATTLTVEGMIYNYYGFDYDQTDRYYVENSLDLLDSPGEWYLDEKTHKLYYWPRHPDEILHGDFIVPRLHQLVHAGSYQANSGWQSSAVQDSYFTSCHHLGVYPEFPETLSFAKGSFTVAAWLRFPAGSEDPFWVFSKGDPLGDNPATGAGGHGYGLQTQSTAATVPVRFYLNDGTHRISTNFPAQPRSKWAHFAFVVDRHANKLQAYVNGALVDTQYISMLGSVASTVPLDIGAYTNAGCSNNAVDDFLIYAKALSATQIAQLAAGSKPSATGLALWLPFDGDFRDHSPRENQTVVFFAPAFTTGVGGARAADFSTPFPCDVSGPTDYVGFSDLTFAYADWVIPFTGFSGSSNFWTSPAAVFLHSRHARVVGNRFEHLGSDALAGLLADSIVDDNEFSDVGGSAIKVGDTSLDPAQQTGLVEFSSNDTISGNRSRDTGIVDRDSFALWVTQGANTTISRNFVSRAPGVGIVSAPNPGYAYSVPPHQGNNRISLNVVDHVMQLLNDGSGIYVDGIQPGTVIDHNVVHDIVATPAHIFKILIFGIYLDGGSREFLVRDNLVYRSEDGGIFLNSYPLNEHNTVTNNIFVDGVEYQLNFYYASNDSFTQNIVYDGQGSITQLFNLFGGCDNVAFIGSSDYNLFFGPSVPPPDLATQLHAWQSCDSFGFDAHSIIADPQFVDYAHDNFALRPSSPAILPIGSGGIGFKPIDFTGLP